MGDLDKQEYHWEDMRRRRWAKKHGGDRIAEYVYDVRRITNG